MEAILFKLIPVSMWVGFFARIVLHIINKDYPYTKNTVKGRTNIKKSIWSGAILGIFFLFALIIKADDYFDTAILTEVFKMVGWILAYMAIGWGWDVLFLKAMENATQTAEKKIDTITHTETTTDTHTEEKPKE